MGRKGALIVKLLKQQKNENAEKSSPQVRCTSGHLALYQPYTRPHLSRRDHEAELDEDSCHVSSGVYSTRQSARVSKIETFKLG